MQYKHAITKPQVCIDGLIVSHVVSHSLGACVYLYSNTAYQNYSVHFVKSQPSYQWSIIFSQNTNFTLNSKELTIKMMQ